MQKIYYYLVFYGLGLISLLPFWVLYRVSDFLYILIRIIGYRKEVIMENLKYSFPEKSEDEIIDIRNKFYHHFSDLFIETFKFQTMSDKQYKKRIVYENSEYINKMFDEGRDVLMAMGHYGNWEWVSTLQYEIKSQLCAIYSPMTNKVFDKYMQFLRTKTGEKVFTMKSSFRDVVSLKNKNQRYVLAMVADQTPGKPNIQYVTSFLNQNTPVHMGLEKMAKKLNDVVIFTRVDKVKRGHYKVTVVPMFENSKDTKEYEITDAVMNYVEGVISETPEYWLWSHKRWKHVDNRDLSLPPYNKYRSGVVYGTHTQ